MDQISSSTPEKKRKYSVLLLIAKIIQWIGTIYLVLFFVSIGIEALYGGERNFILSFIVVLFFLNVAILVVLSRRPESAWKWVGGYIGLLVIVGALGPKPKTMDDIIWPLMAFQCSIFSIINLVLLLVDRSKRQAEYKKTQLPA